MIFPSFETKKEFCVSFFFCYLALALANTCTQENVRALTTGWSEALKGRSACIWSARFNKSHSPRWRSKYICSRLISTLFVHQVCRCTALLSLFVYVCVYMCVWERVRDREIVWFWCKLLFWGILGRFMQSKPREWFEWIFEGSAEIPLSYMCHLQSKVAAIAAAPGFLFTKLNTSGTSSLPKLSYTVLLFTEEEEEEEEEEDLEEDVLF